MSKPLTYCVLITVPAVSCVEEEWQTETSLTVHHRHHAKHQQTLDIYKQHHRLKGIPTIKGSTIFLPELTSLSQYDPEYR